MTCDLDGLTDTHMSAYFDSPIASNVMSRQQPAIKNVFIWVLTGYWFLVPTQVPVLSSNRVPVPNTNLGIHAVASTIDKD